MKIIFQNYNIPEIERGVKLPTFIVESQYKKDLKLQDKASNFDFLCTLVKKGFQDKILANNVIKTNQDLLQKYIDRIDTELNTYKELGFIDYVLITWDIVRYCRENKIAMGVGRGSSCGSIVLYLIDITKVDSIKYHLYFERFLSKVRASYEEIDNIKYYDGSNLMDCDLDIDFLERERVIRYLNQKYPNRVAKLVNLVTLTTRNLIREVCKSVLEYTDEQATAVSSYIPKIFGQVKDLDFSYEHSKPFQDFIDQNPIIMEVGRKLHKINRNFGVHASAWAITADNVNRYFPLQLDKDKEWLTSYAMDDALEVAIKVDLLGLKTARLVDDICKDVGISVENINTNDPKIYKGLQNLRTPYGLFQIEERTNFQVARKVRPRNLEQLTAVVALARPGALQFVDQYADYVNKNEFSSVHPFFDGILKDTAGVCLYQEQLMEMCNKIGFSLEDSNQIRKIVGKKKLDEVKEWEKKVKQKVLENQLEQKIGDLLWKIINDSANYQFVRGHAAAYAILCAITCYLKFNYPQKFFLHALRMVQHKTQETARQLIGRIVLELPYYNIQLLPPHIAKSELDFSIEGSNIRYGLDSIKGIADKTRQKLIDFRKNYSNKFDLFVAAEEVNIPINVLGSLILSGCLDEVLGGNSRARLLYEAQIWYVLSLQEKRKCLQLGQEFKYNLVSTLKYIREKPVLNDRNKPIINDRRRQTIKGAIEDYNIIYGYNKKNKKLCDYVFEMKFLGYAYSTTLKEIFAEHTSDLIDIIDIKNMRENQKLHIAGEVMEIKKGRSKEKGTPYIKMLVRDHTGEILCMGFETERNACLSEIRDNYDRLPQNKDIVVCRGSKKNDVMFAENVSIQEIKIFDKITQLPKNDEIII